MSVAPGRMALYALEAALEMAAAEESRPVAAAHVARTMGVSEAVLAKAFQQLVRAGLAVGVRGSAGGYRLSRPASEITVLSVLEAFASTAPRRGLLPRIDPRLEKLFDEVEELVRCTYASVTLSTLAGTAKAAEGSP